MLRVIQVGKDSAERHMARDRALLVEGSQDPLLFLYEWDSLCITYGLFANPERALRMDVCQSSKIPVVLRPTGGGILFHENDFSFSLFIPHPYLNGSLDDFWSKLQAAIFSTICPCLDTFLQRENATQKCPLIDRFCMAEAHECDFVWNKYKYGGAAFRKGKKGWLCQATLFVGGLSWEKCATCLRDPLSLENMKVTSIFLPRVKNFQKDVAKAIVRCFV